MIVRRLFGTFLSGSIGIGFLYFLYLNAAEGIFSSFLHMLGWLVGLVALLFLGIAGFLYGLSLVFGD